MPKKVDHDQRRREIADALLRLAAAEGLESVSLRHVAAEAGVSMGAVQHYFRSKEAMLGFAQEHLGQRREQRVRARLGEFDRPPTVREIVRTSMVEVMPTDELRRAEHLAGIAFFIRAMSEPTTAATMAEGVPKLHDFFADLLGRAQQDGLLAPGVDVRKEAVLLWSLVDALSTSVVLGECDAGAAVETVDYYLDRLFRADPAG